MANGVKAEQINLDAVEEGTSLWQDAWFRLSKNKMAMFGLFTMLLITLLALLAPWIAPYSYEEQNLALGVSGPSSSYWLGTDGLGRDLFTRILYGARVSLAVGFLSTAVAILVGVIYGACSGYFGGKVDSIMMRIIDILYSLPFTFLVILLMVMFGRDFYLLFIALGLISWLTIARIVRGQVLSIRRKEFIEGAISLGISQKRIVLKHVIPNVLGVVVVYSTLTVPRIMLEEAFLSFIGLGVQPPMSSWGILISEGVKYMEEFPGMMIFPGITLSLTVFSLNFLGDGLRDALDPKSSKD